MNAMADEDRLVQLAVDAAPPLTDEEIHEVRGLLFPTTDAPALTTFTTIQVTRTEIKPRRAA